MLVDMVTIVDSFRKCLLCPASLKDSKPKAGAAKMIQKDEAA